MAKFVSHGGKTFQSAKALDVLVMLNVGCRAKVKLKGHTFAASVTLSEDPAAPWRSAENSRCYLQ